MSAFRSKDSSLPAVVRYAASLRNSRKSRLPAGVVVPQPPSAWPVENVALLERYLVWLVEDGAGQSSIAMFYLPMAGHVLGLNLKPHSQLDLAADLERAMAFVKAKRPTEQWEKLCQLGLNRFRRFLCQERGLSETAVSFPGRAGVNVERYHDGLPDWLVAALTHYQHLRQANWRPARLDEAILRFWATHSQLWRWLFAHYPIEAIADVKRSYIFAYLDERLAAGANPKTINQELRAWIGTLRFLQGRDFAVPQALLTISGLKEPDALPRFLTDEQVHRLRADLEQRVVQADGPVQKRNALLDRAAFYLMWQGGLRLGEVEELGLADLNLAQGQVMVRQGKGRQDRAVYLTETAVTTLQAYLAVRGDGQSDHLFLYRHRPLCKDFLRGRMKAAGERAGVKVTPHMLRHTFATQLLNAGCRVTTIQVLLGHKRLNSTMVYARVHDQTVARDYFAAMAVIEERLAANLAQKTDQYHGTNGHGASVNGNAVHLLRLVTALQADPLTESQQAVVAELQQGLEALTDSVNGFPKQMEQGPPLP
ncbi:MAG: tyrosine-type recombinase/integrase [Chloroflexi bacterium]|nr:tyrosine-type recombinase/integrase [Chloroflexota bacterium]